MKTYIKSIKWIILGNLFYSLALNLFLVENRIAAGGFAGIATLINHFIKVPIGFTVFVLNIPLVIWAWKTKGSGYASRCITGSVIYTIIADATSFLPVLTTMKILAAIMGGVVYGIGIAIMVKCQAAAGGTDLLSRLMIELKPFKKMSVGSMILCLDGTVVIAAAIVYGNIMQAFYTIIGILTYSIISDVFQRMTRKINLLDE